MYRPALHSFACSKMFLNIKICSVVLLFSLHPVCSFRSFLSIPILIRSSIILQNMLLLMGSKVTHSQVVTVAQITFLEYLDDKPLLPHFRPVLRLPKPVITSSQPTCGVFHVCPQLVWAHFIYSRCFPSLCHLQSTLNLFLDLFPQSLSVLLPHLLPLDLLGHPCFNRDGKSISLKCSTLPLPGYSLGYVV